MDLSLSEQFPCHVWRSGGRADAGLADAGVSGVSELSASADMIPAPVMGLQRWVKSPTAKHGLECQHTCSQTISY